MKKDLKCKKGITLVALVITIIILLLLAGITIAQLTGNGLFKKTLKAEEESNLAQILEHIKLIVYEKNIEKQGKATLEDVFSADDKILKKYVELWSVLICEDTPFFFLKNSSMH